MQGVPGLLASIVPYIQGRNFTKFWGCQRFPCETFACDLFLSNSNSPMVICPVNCSAEVHFTTNLPCETAIFSTLEGGRLIPHTPLSFVPAYSSNLYDQNAFLRGVTAAEKGLESSKCAACFTIYCSKVLACKEGPFSNTFWRVPLGIPNGPLVGQFTSGAIKCRKKCF